MLQLLIGVVLHCGVMVASKGKHRVFISIINDIFIAITIGLVFLGVWLFNQVFGFASSGVEAGIETGSFTIGCFGAVGGTVVAIGGGAVCFLLSFFTFAYGVLSQFVLMIVALISSIKPSEENPRGWNLLTMFICAASIAVGIVGFYLLINSL